MVVRILNSPEHGAWRVWAVHPAGILTERRLAADRRRVPDDVAADRPARERRIGNDRRRARFHDRSRATRVLPPQWQNGWLVFEADDSQRSSAQSADVRRLAPIPEDWESCPEAALASYLGRASITRLASNTDAPPP